MTNSFRNDRFSYKGAMKAMKVRSFFQRNHWQSKAHRAWFFLCAGVFGVLRGLCSLPEPERLSDRRRSDCCRCLLVSPSQRGAVFRFPVGLSPAAACLFSGKSPVRPAGFLRQRRSRAFRAGVCLSQLLSRQGSAMTRPISGSRRRAVSSTTGTRCFTRC